MRNLLLSVLSGTCGGLGIIVVSLLLRVDSLEGRLAALEAKGDRTGNIQARLTYHDIQLAGHAEALVDWYAYRRARSQGWGTGHYWAGYAAARMQQEQQ